MANTWKKTARVYLDTAYIAKYYLPEPDSERVRKLIAQNELLISSSIATGEHSVRSSSSYARRKYAERTAKNGGEDTIWTNDGHLLGAASHFGLIGRTV